MPVPFELIGSEVTASLNYAPRLLRREGVVDDKGFMLAQTFRVARALYRDQLAEGTNPRPIRCKRYRSTDERRGWEKSGIPTYNGTALRPCLRFQSVATMRSISSQVL
jgi:hypothetical protein